MAAAIPTSALAVIRGRPDQRGELAAANRAQFRHPRNNDGRNHRSHALGALQNLIELPILSMFAQMLRDGPLDRLALAFQKTNHSSNPAAVGRTNRLLLAVVLSREHRDQLLAPSYQFLEPFSGRARRDIGTWANLGGEQRQTTRIQTVSLGQLTIGLGKMVRVAGVNPGGRNPRRQ